MSRTRRFWLPKAGDAHTCVIIKVLTALQQSLRVMGNSMTKKKNADYWIEYFAFEKFFLTENNKTLRANNRRVAHFVTLLNTGI